MSHNIAIFQESIETPASKATAITLILLGMQSFYSSQNMPSDILTNDNNSQPQKTRGLDSNIHCSSVATYSNVLFYM
jgi:hypothetical protein